MAIKSSNFGMSGQYLRCFNCGRNSVKVEKSDSDLESDKSLIDVENFEDKLITNPIYDEEIWSTTCTVCGWVEY